MKEIWRIGFWILLAFNVVFIIGAVLWMLAFNHNLGVVAQGAPICLADYRKYDSIAAAQMIGRLDLVSFLLTGGGLLFAVFALIGFWAVRRDVMDQAATVATQAASDIAQNYYSKENEKRTNGGDKSIDNDYSQPKPSVDVASVSTAGAVEVTGAKDDKPE